MTPRYPLGEHARDTVRARSGRPLADLTMAQVREGQLSAADLAIHPDTLRQQAEIAEEAGFPHLAANLRRAAELAIMPNERVMALYEALRPYRVTHQQLLALADQVEREWDAVETARLIREAAAAYRERGLCS